MGKKSKRKSNNKPPCCHGCTKKEFNNCGEHYNIVERWDKQKTLHEKRMDFIITNSRYSVDPKFGNYVIARITADFLNGKDDGILVHRLLLLLHIRYLYIPMGEGKDVGPESKYTTDHNKYKRDILTKRGRINVIAREIPCGCMKERKIEANKSMEKVAMCFQCGNEFSKKQMLRCLGCDFAQYCSKECRIKDWPNHKKSCTKHDVSSASTPAPRDRGQQQQQQQRMADCGAADIAADRAAATAEIENRLRSRQSAAGSLPSVEEPSDVDVDAAEE